MTTTGHMINNNTRGTWDLHVYVYTEWMHPRLKWQLAAASAFVWRVRARNDFIRTTVVMVYGCTVVSFYITIFSEASTRHTSQSHHITTLIFWASRHNHNFLAIRASYPPWNLHPLCHSFCSPLSNKRLHSHSIITSVLARLRLKAQRLCSIPKSQMIKTALPENFTESWRWMIES